MRPRLARLRPTVGWLAVGVLVSTVILSAVGYRVLLNAERSALLLATRRAEQAADLLATAIRRDMRGVQTSVLFPIINSPSNATRLVAGAFARFPYPESFFRWNRGAPPDSVTFFHRADRYPPWTSAKPEAPPFPVVTAHDTAMAARLLSELSRDLSSGHRLAIFALTVGGEPYQVVAALAYDDEYASRPREVFGFMVNLAWIRRHYFGDLTQQVSRMLSDDDVSLSILDERGAAIAGVPGSPQHGPVVERRFSVMFFNPADAPAALRSNFSPVYWSAQAVGARDATLRAARATARPTLAIAGLAGVVLALGLALTARATRAQARVTEMRADFVTAVTHELKTPIAALRVVGETLASGRINTIDACREYARLAVQETSRLTRLVDNLLTYARVTDAVALYRFEPVDLHTAVEATLQEFSMLLAARRFEVQVDVPGNLPPVRADRSFLGLLLDNLVDNAIRYSTARRWLRIAARDDGTGGVVLEVEDKGVGIDEAHLPHVTEKFFRGSRNASGSGLGLAIAQRLVSDHDGSLTIHSTVGVGTTISVRLPAHRGPAVLRGPAGQGMPSEGHV